MQRCLQAAAESRSIFSCADPNLGAMIISARAARQKKHHGRLVGKGRLLTPSTSSHGRSDRGRRSLLNSLSHPTVLLAHTRQTPTNLAAPMSDDVVGSCFALAFAACYDVCLGICIDFLSVREYHSPSSMAANIRPTSFSTGHACTETLCSCRRRPSLESLPSEREPLIHSTEPSAHPPMLKAPAD